MDRGYLIVALGEEYIKQANLCASTIKKTQPNINSVSIITDNPELCSKDFDNKFEISEEETRYAVNIRSKIYELTPYEETVVIDADMLFLTDIEHWWSTFAKRDLLFTNNVKTYKNKTVTSRYYREIFDKAYLPNIYVGCFYFKKSELAEQFFTLLGIISKKTEYFYNKIFGKGNQTTPSFDVSSAIAVKLLDIEHMCILKDVDIPTFTHMKPQIQNWSSPTYSWQDKVSIVWHDNKLYINGFKQHGIFHYTESTFAEKII
jgi:hypothetical protein